MKKTLFIVIGCVFILWSESFSEIPRMINFQGELLENGQPVNGSKSLTFEFFNSETGGSKITTFSETQTVDVENGIFNTIIGKDTNGGIPSEVFNETSVWLQIIVNDDPPIELPRQRMLAVGYAFKSEKSDGITSCVVTSTNIINGTITNDDIANTAGISGTKILPNFGTQNIITLGNNMSIGETLSPDASLTVKSDGIISMLGNYYSGSCGYVGTITDHRFDIRINNTPKLTITPGGDVGINTTIPNSKLHIFGTGSNGAGARIILGDDLFGTPLYDINCYIAEDGWYDFLPTDSNILELHGKLVFCLINS